MEIGSEFSVSENFLDKANASFLSEPFFKNAAFFSTGRAAIFAAVQDIKKTRSLKKAYLPDYCCYSMVEPFLKNGIEVIYYGVDFLNGTVEYKINFEQDFDIFFCMSYFGFEASNQDQIVQKIKQKGATVIEDITHRLLTGRKSNADYFVASLRKWFAIVSGGILIKQNGSVKSGSLPLGNDFLNLRESAMLKKAQYLSANEQSEDKKAEFLSEYSKANKLLCTNWQDVAIDSKSLNMLNRLDTKAIASLRKENAKAIYSVKLKNAQFMFSLADCDVPLFVPIIFGSSAERDAIKFELCENKIYCPVHWPNEIGSQNPIYSRVLSIVVDQRYSASDMEKIVKILEKGV